MMQRAFSFPLAAERSRYKERLEASLAALCELDLLKQRQESLVLSALRLGDCGSGCGRAAWPLIRHCFPNSADLEQEEPGTTDQQGLMAVLQQQVGDLRVDTESSSTERLTDTGDNATSSGDALAISCDKFLDNVGSAGRSLLPRSLSSPQPPLLGIAKRGDGEPWLWPEHNGAGEEAMHATEDYHQTQHMETYILGLIQRRLLTTRQCKPRTNLSPEARGVVRQSSLCRKEPTFTPEHCKTPPNPDRPTWVSYSLEEEQLSVFSPVEHHPGHYSRPEEQLLTHYSRSEDQLSTHYPRPEDQLSIHYPRPALSGIHSPSMDYPSGDMDPSSSEADSHQLPQSPSSDEQMVNAQYIPAQPTQAPVRAKTSRAHAAPKASRGGGTYSPERPQPKPRAVPKKCRFTEERTAVKKPGRKTCRSQSENSLLGQKGVPERKYSTVERDAGRVSQSKTRRQQGNLGHRRWRSTLELSQDEAEPPPEREVRRSRRSRPAPPTYVYNQAPQHHHHAQHHFHHPHVQSDYPLHTSMSRPEGYKHTGPADWESSLSEGESPGSSSMTSDSDESGGLVWPQQLAPPLAPPSPPTTSGPPLQSKALVKIKASHALKKKILRFRTGSLKVMTTV